MTKPNDQTEKLKIQLSAQTDFVTERLALPGIETLHTKGAAEIAQVLANVIKSRHGVTKISFTFGECVEITYNSNPHGQLR